MPLPDDVIVYPAHGAGSACGKSMSKDTFDTLGSQKKNNYALADISKAEFIKQLTEGILPAPQYFAKNAALNKSGYDAYEQVIARGRKGLRAVEFQKAIAEKDALVLDVRPAQEFAAAHIPGSLFIGLDGQFAPWVGTIIRDLSTPIYLVCPTGKEEETIMRLARVGYDQCRAFLHGGFGGGHVQFNQLFHAGEGFFGQAEEVLNVGFLGGDHLFWGHHGQGSFKVKFVSLWNCAGIMLRRSMG